MLKFDGNKRINIEVPNDMVSADCKSRTNLEYIEQLKTLRHDYEMGYGGTISVHYLSLKTINRCIDNEKTSTMVYPTVCLNVEEDDKSVIDSFGPFGDEEHNAGLYCPNCSLYFGHGKAKYTCGDVYITDWYSVPNYCPHCGQAIYIPKEVAEQRKKDHME